MSSLGPAFPRNRRAAAFERGIAARLQDVLRADEPIVVACSGGPDSVATLVALTHTLTAARVTAAHFDHGLRVAEETAADAAYVSALAARLGVGFALGHADGPLPGDEASARTARYRWLATALTEHGATSAVTGHTRDDQAETVLLNLVRGAGLRGASGMALESAWPVADSPDATRLRVLRPLLAVSRAEVEAYLEALELEARVDPTNELTSYARNRVRLVALPVLETVNTQARAQIAAFAGRAREADEALEVWAAREFEALIDSTAAESLGLVRINRRGLQGLPAAVAKRVVARAAGCAGLELDAWQREEAVRLASRKGAALDLPGGSLTTDADWVSFSSACG
ncbi:MAG: tRNA lysidine(34) synthetase TilS [Chloroflexi bacterium]|nr:tRNA lysidine(34) synthetase TilS [Chloroflexota bacterium]MDA1147919.1 tRNA lysidine(34) synthetase TilS [Chloroflexota bacterium]MQC82530.1 tRNA lysidine(34) synthetase TilS [Chloroflexota bacterium]